MRKKDPVLILKMFDFILKPIGLFIINIISSSGYFGIFILMTVESALIPMPSEITMPFSGFLVTTGRFNFWLVVIMGTFGNLVGSLAAYYLGLRGHGFVENFINRFGKYILISKKEFHHAENWFKRYGELIVFISRLMPAVRTYISLPAGIAQMEIKKFIIYTTIGSFIWSIFLTYTGVFLGQKWENIKVYFHRFDLLILAGVIFAAVFFFYKKRSSFKRT